MPILLTVYNSISIKNVFEFVKSVKSFNVKLFLTNVKCSVFQMLLNVL